MSCKSYVRDCLKRNAWYRVPGSGSLPSCPWKCSSVSEHFPNMYKALGAIPGAKKELAKLHSMKTASHRTRPGSNQGTFPWIVDSFLQLNWVGVESDHQSFLKPSRWFCQRSRLKTISLSQMAAALLPSAGLIWRWDGNENLLRQVNHSGRSPAGILTLT